MGSMAEGQATSVASTSSSPTVVARGTGCRGPRPRQPAPVTSGGTSVRRSLLSLIAAVSLVAMLAPAASAIPVHWTAKGGRAFTDVARGPDGSLYVAGIDRSSITAAASVRKYSPDGSLRWTRSWVPYPQASANGLGVTVGTDGTIYLMGVVRGQCEGQGWFVRAYKPGGDLRWKYVTPGWANCTLAEFPTDIAARGNLVVVSGFSHGCCGDQFHDGWITAFKPNLVKRFRANAEPPSTPLAWFDAAWGVGISPAGSIFVSGWAATGAIPRETSPTPGTPFLERLDPHGHKIWSKRADASMPTMYLPVALGLSAKRAVIAAGVGGKDVTWGFPPTTGWVASYTLAGHLRWKNRFGGGENEAAAPSGVGIDGDGRVWVLSTRRDAGDHGTDGLVRLYSSKGKLRDKRRIDPSDRYVRTGGIAAFNTGAAATGWIGTQYQYKGGRLWRLVA